MGGGNRYFSEYNYDGSRKEDEAPDWDAWLDVHTSKPRTVDQDKDDPIKEAQLKILNDLKSAIESHKPSFRHQQNSSFDNGKANGLCIAMMYIDIKIKELV